MEQGIQSYTVCMHQEDRSVRKREDGRDSRKDKGLLGIPTRMYNRWWREIKVQRERGKRGRE